MASRSRTGMAAILAGSLIFAGQGGELVFGSPSDFVDVLLVGLGCAGFVALVVAYWGLREVIVGTRVGRVADLDPVAPSAGGGVGLFTPERDPHRDSHWVAFER